MPKFVEFPLEGGGSIIIETVEEKKAGTSGFVKGGEAAAEQADQARQSFDASVENVRRSADLLAGKLRGLSQPPDEMELYFSLKATGELGNLVVAKSGGESNFNITLKWRREEKKDEAKKDEKSEA
jgi:hypothetical protein